MKLICYHLQKSAFISSVPWPGRSVVLLRPSSSSEEHERNEANSKLKDLWGKAVKVVKGKEKKEEIGEDEL